MEDTITHIYEQNIPFAITDKTLNIVFANGAFGNLMGENMFHPVYKILEENDVNRVMEQVARLQTGKQEELLVGIGVSGKKHPAIMELEGRSDGNLNVWIKDIYWMSERLAENSIKVQKYRACLVLEEDICFEYNRETDHFALFWLKDEQIIHLYKGSLAGFEKKMISGARVAQTDIGRFKEFCEDLREGISGFHYELTTNILDNIRTKEIYRIKGRTVSGDLGRDITVGICSRYDRVNNSKQDSMLAEIYIDPLTGVMKKKDFESFAAEQFKDGAKGGVALCLIDIDYFKSVNDTYGHKYGDRVLKSVGDILKKATGSNGVPARIGGDEFAIILTNVLSELELRNVLRAIRSSFQWLDPGKLDKLHFGCSMGVARYPQDGKTYEQLFQVADNALYLAKLKGRNRYIIYEEDKHGDLVKAENAISVLKTSFTSYNGVEFGGKLAELFLKGEEYCEDFLSYLLKIYELDRIQIFWNDMNIPVYGVSRKKESQECAGASYVWKEGFGRLLNGKQYLYFPMIFQLEYTEPELFTEYKKCGIETTFQYVFEDTEGKVCGLLSFDKCDKHVTWSSDTINNFVMISAVFEKLLQKTCK